MIFGFFSPEQKEKVKDKDTDSIGSASDLKHEDDTTDDERHGDQPGGVAVQVHPADPEKTEEEDNTAFDCVQYGTLEETVSAIVSGSNQSILQETSNKPLLEMGFDKSDDDELESRGNATTHLPQRRLTFEGMGLLSVFDQIPFRYSKKSKGIASKVSEVQNTPRLIDGEKRIHLTFNCTFIALLDWSIDQILIFHFILYFVFEWTLNSFFDTFCIYFVIISFSHEFKINFSIRLSFAY